MQYTKTLTTKTGSELYLRNGDAPDGCAALAVFNKTHAETEYLLTYPDESSMTAEQEAEFLAQATKSAREIEILAFVDGQLAGTAGINAVGKPCKLVHRAEFGIGILQAYWGQGIGYALTAACIDCARQAGYMNWSWTWWRTTHGRLRCIKSWVLWSMGATHAGSASGTGTIRSWCT